MIPADDVVQRIDDTLDDYVTWHGSPDAMRWSPDAEPGLSGDGGDPDRGTSWPVGRVGRQVSMTIIDESHTIVRPAGDLIPAQYWQQLARTARETVRLATIWNAAPPVVTGDVAPLRPLGITRDDEPDEDADPRQQALDARRNRNTGPQRETFARRGRRRG
jgi:hypothetical protein